MIGNPTMQDPITERWLDQQDVDWDFERISVALIDKPKSRANNARDLTIHPDHVETLQRMVAHGAVVAPIIVNKMANGRYMIIDGNHRDEVFRKLNVDKVYAYVLNVDDTRYTKLKWLANERNGLRPTDAERRDHAVALVHSGIANISEAAVMFGITRHVLQRDVSAADARNRAVSLGIKFGVDRISVTTWQKLAAVRSEPAFIELVKLADSKKLTVGEIQDLITAVNQESTDARKVEVIDDVKEQLKSLPLQATKVGGANKRQMAARIRIRGVLGQAMKLSAAEVKASCLSPEEWEEVQKRVVETITHLETFIA